jgi:hypothetical protein
LIVFEEPNEIFEVWLLGCGTSNGSPARHVPKVNDSQLQILVICIPTGFRP